MRIEDVTKELLEQIIKECTSTKEILTKLNIDYSGTNHRTINFLIRQYNIDISHFNYKKQHKLKKLTKKELQELVNTNTSLRGIFKVLNLSCVSTNYKRLRNTLNYYEIPYKHIYNTPIAKGQACNHKRPNNIMFSENSPSRTDSVKKRIIKENLKLYECEICHIKDWLNKPLVLVLDHINGINTDNRLENLRFLCSNCNSQTDTFTGRNKKLNKSTQR